jgi:DNA-binding beta-propeller fold protein YncE
MDGALDGVLDGSGELLYFVDSFNGTVRRFGVRAGRVITLAGQAGVEGSSDGVGARASFENPRGIALDEARGRLYVNDGFNCTIRTVELDTTRVRTLAGEVGQCGHADGTYTEARFGLVIGTTMSPDGRYLYLADRSSQTIRRLDLQRRRVETVAGAPGERGHMDGQGAAARFSGPGGIAFGPSGRYLYVNDTFNNVIRRVDTRDFTVVTVAGAPGEGGNVDGVGRAARFAVSQGLTVAGSTAYVAGFHGSVRALALGAETSTAVAVETVAGANGQRGSRDGALSEARFGVAFGIVAHPDHQRLFYFDRGNNNIRLVDLARGRVETVMGPASPTGWADGSLGVSRFSDPQGVVTSTSGQQLFVADRGNDVVRRVDRASGFTETLFGRPGAPGTEDGRFDGASLDTPHDLVLSPDGRTLYVSESRALRAFDMVTFTSTTLTSRPPRDAESAVNGPLGQATFSAPRGMTRSSDGRRLFVADSGFDALREVDLDARTVRSLAPTALNAAGLPEAVTLRGPSGVALSADEQTLYFTDRSRHVVWQMELATQTATVIAGRLDERGAFDGVRTEAAFSFPDDLALEAGGGALFVTDGFGHAIRRVDTSTFEVTTVVGRLGVSGGIGVGPRVSFEEARLYFPAGIAATPRGLVFTADEGVFEATFPRAR